MEPRKGLGWETDVPCNFENNEDQDFLLTLGPRSIKYQNYGNSKDQIFRVFPEFSKPQHDDQKKMKCFVESIEGVDAG